MGRHHQPTVESGPSSPGQADSQLLRPRERASVAAEVVVVENWEFAFDASTVAQASLPGQKACSGCCCGRSLRGRRQRRCLRGGDRAVVVAVMVIGRSFG